jgi:ABC-type multidrug transport system ATPase subunit
MARLKDMNKRDAKERVAELIEILNLEAKAKSRISGLSGGMKQRLMLAQALLNNPKILILDEPTAGVDPQERIQIRNYISTLSRDRIVIIATHIVSDVEAIANKIYLIGGGRVIKQGAPEELIQNIADKVYDISVDYEEIQRIQEKYVVGNISSRTDGIHVKIISDNVPEEYTYERCAANLEDVYLEAFAV